MKAAETEDAKVKKLALHRALQDEAREELMRIAMERRLEIKASEHAVRQKHAHEALLHIAMVTIREQALHEKLGEAREHARAELRVLASMARTSEVARLAAHVEKQVLSRTILTE